MARLAERLAIGVGKDVLLRLIRALPDPKPEQVRVLGVDDFALRRRHRYGTVLVDIEAGRVVDVLPERSADALAAWLEAHAGVEVVCRDRGGCYTEGAARAAPTATQVADRWHLWNNLCTAVERLVARLRSDWGPPTPEPTPAAVPDKPEGRRAQRTRERHAAVHALMAKGVDVGGIAAALRLDRKTVRRFMRAATPEELIGDNPSGRHSSLDGHAAYLTARWAEGCASTSRLHQELRDRGALVSQRTVRRFLLRLRQNATATARPPVPKIREVATLVLTHPDHLVEDDAVLLKELRDRCADLDTACRLVTAFAKILVHRRGKQQLEGWGPRRRDPGVRARDAVPMRRLEGLRQLGRQHARPGRDRQPDLGWQ